MNGFDYNPTIRVISGEGTLGKLGECAVALGARRVLLVTDAGIVKAGIAERATDALKQASVDAVVFDETVENPTSDLVAAGAKFAAEQGGIDPFDPRSGQALIVGLGGGSAMDTAKGINFILTNGGRMEDYKGHGLAKKPMLPSIGIPTTAGTGSEAQSFALISRSDTHEKMACGDVKARFRTVILDPELTKSVPGHVAAATGIDAISHALESYVCRRRNAVSSMFARDAWRMLSSRFGRVTEDPDDVEARGAMLVGAHFAGVAIENAMLGAAHACANPLTARYDITHGVAVGLMLPSVIRFNADAVGDLYAELGEPAEELAARVERLKEAAGLPASLREMNVPRDELGELAVDASQQWTGTFNPRAVGKDEFLSLYEAAY